MKYQNDFTTEGGFGFFRYEIVADDNSDQIIFRYQRLHNGHKGQEMPDEDMLISKVHIANIPAVVTAIFSVFQMKEGGRVSIEDNGDKVFAIMHFDDHGQFKALKIRDKSGRVKTGIDASFEFVFEDLILINNPPLPRTPTPAMIWVSDTLKKIHDDWEKRNTGATV